MHSPHTPTMSNPPSSPPAQPSNPPSRSNSMSRPSPSVSRSSSISGGGRFRFTNLEGVEDNSAPTSRNPSRPSSAWGSPVASPSVEAPIGTWYVVLASTPSPPEFGRASSGADGVLTRFVWGCRPYSSANSSQSSVASNATNATTRNKDPSFGMSAGNTSALCPACSAPAEKC